LFFPDSDDFDSEKPIFSNLFRTFFNVPSCPKMNTRAQSGGGKADETETSESSTRQSSCRSKRNRSSSSHNNNRRKKIEREKSLKSKKSKSTENRSSLKSVIGGSELVLSRKNLESESRSSDPESAQFIPGSGSSDIVKEVVSSIQRVVSDQDYSNCQTHLVSSTSQTGEKLKI
jgi:hypothetical protein